MNKFVNPLTLARRRYLIQFTIAMTAYVFILFWSIWMAKRFTENPVHTLIALAPLLPIVFLFASIVQYVNSIDELERQIQSESLALAAGITALLAVTYGFLEVAGFPRISAWFTYLVVMGAWILARPFVARRYK